MSQPARLAAPSSPGARLAVTAVFAVAMGWLEAVVVVYIRAVLGLAHGAMLPNEAELLARFQALPWLLPTEQGREAATLVMLGAAGWLAGDRLRSRFGAFLVCFGLWDLVYYAGLYALVGWPRSLLAMDVLFLIPPGPWWNQPVWVPVAISLAMVGLGGRLFLKR